VVDTGVAAALRMLAVSRVEAAAPEPGPAEADSSAGGLEEVVVTARKREETSQTVPISINALSSKDLITHNVQAVAGLKQQVPSLRMQTTQYTAFGIELGMRGQQQADSLIINQPSVGLYLDG